MAGTSQPFRRFSDPLMVPCAPTATQFVVPDGFFTQDAQWNAFYVVNRNAFWVRLRGTTAGPFQPVTETTGWLFPPGFAGVFSTQYPRFMSAMAISVPGYPPAGEGIVELAYGIGA